MFPKFGATLGTKGPRVSSRPSSRRERLAIIQCEPPATTPVHSQAQHKEASAARKAKCFEPPQSRLGVSSPRFQTVLADVKRRIQGERARGSRQQHAGQHCAQRDSASSHNGHILSHEVYYRRALKIAPASAQLLNNLANHYLASGKAHPKRKSAFQCDQEDNFRSGILAPQP